jgi:hypothetical protein
MSRFGNARPPAAEGERDVLHAWALVNQQSPALLLFELLEQQLDDVAQRLGAVTLGSPTYETFRPADPGVPPELRVAAAACDCGPVWLVHGWVRFQARTQPAAAREVADLYGVPTAELNAALIGGP